MKYLTRFILAAALTLHSSAASAAIAHIASTTAGSAAGTTVTTSGIDTTGANLIVVAVSYYSLSDPTLTDSKGNTWTALTARELNSTAASVKLFYCVPTSVGSGHTFTATQASTFPTVSVSAFSGAAASPFDQQSGSATSGAVTSFQPGSITPSENNCVLVTGITTGGTAHTINSSFNATSIGNNAAGANMGGGIAYKIQTTAGAENPTWSWTTSAGKAAAMASFKASANVINPLSSTIPGSGIDPLNRGPVQ